MTVAGGAADSNKDDLIARGGKVDREVLLSRYGQQTGDDETPIAVRFTLSRDLNKRLDRYLVDRIPFLSRTSLQRLIREQAVTVNGLAPKPSTRLRAGDEVRQRFDHDLRRALREFTDARVACGDE